MCGMDIKAFIDALIGRASGALSWLGTLLPALAALVDKTKGLIPTAIAFIRDKARACALLLVFAVAFYFTYTWVPEKTGPMFYLVARIAGGGFIGYWVDRILFPYARPHALKGIEQGAAQKRRAMIVSAAIVAAGFQL